MSQDVGDDLSTLTIDDHSENTWLLELLEDKQTFRALTKAGKISQTIGRDTVGQTLLSVPEGVFLLENGRARLYSRIKTCTLLRKLLKEYANSAAPWKAYHKLKLLGYIIEHTNDLPWDIYKPDGKFRKSSPSGLLGSLSHCRADDLFSFTTQNGQEQYYCVSDMSCQLFFRARWVDLQPTRNDEEDNFCIAKSDLPI